MSQQDSFQQMALFRYSLIAPAIAGTFEAASMAQYFRHVAAKTHRRPDGKSVSVSVWSLERWYYRYKRFGLAGITPKARADAGTTRVLSAAAIEQIAFLKGQFPHITGKALYQKLIESGHVDAGRTSLSTLHRYIRTHGLKAPSAGALEVKAFEMEFANDCWQADTSHGPNLCLEGKGQPTFIIAFLDDASRLLLHAQCYFRDNAVNMQDAFKAAIAKFGVPKRLFVDNGKTYDNLQLKLICASLGIVLIHARPYAAASKGKIERSFRTIKDGWMHTIDWKAFSSLQELNASLASFLLLLFCGQSIISSSALSHLLPRLQ